MAGAGVCLLSQPTPRPVARAASHPAEDEFLPCGTGRAASGGSGPARLPAAYVTGPGTGPV